LDAFKAFKAAFLVGFFEPFTGCVAFSTCCWYLVLELSRENLAKNLLLAVRTWSSWGIPQLCGKYLHVRGISGVQEFLSSKMLRSAHGIAIFLV
jgi:hypothetical protein